MKGEPPPGLLYKGVVYTVRAPWCTLYTAAKPSNFPSVTVSTDKGPHETSCTMERGGLQMMLLIFVSAVAAESPCSIAEASVPDVAALRKLLDGGAKPDECRSWVRG